MPHSQWPTTPQHEELAETTLPSKMGMAPSLSCQTLGLLLEGLGLLDRRNMYLQSPRSVVGTRVGTLVGTLVGILVGTLMGMLVVVLVGASWQVSGRFSERISGHISARILVSAY